MSAPEATCKTVYDPNNNQNAKLFALGNNISDDPHCKGIIKLPKPPIKIGITTKNIIIIPCIVITVL